MLPTINTQNEIPEHKPSRFALSEMFGVVLVAAALTLFYTNPLWRHPGSYLSGPGDPLQHISVSWWTGRKMLSGRLAGMWALPPMYYPAGNSLAYGDPQFGVTLLGLPIFAATKNIILAYNFVVLIAMPLSALAAYALVRHLSGSRAAALAAAVGWGFGIWHSGESAHQQVLSLEALPLVLLALHGYGETGRGRYLATLFGAWLVQEFLAEYWGGFLLLLVAPCALLMLRLTYGLSWRRVSTAFAIIALAALPWLIAQRPLLANTLHGSGHHSRQEIMTHSADLADYLPPKGTLLWGSMGTFHRAPEGAGQSGEAMVSPGLLLDILALMGMLSLVRLEKRSEPAAEATGRWAHAQHVGFVGLTLFGLFRVLLQAFGMDFLPLPGSDTSALPASFFTWMCVTSAMLLFNAPLRTAARRYRLHLTDSRSPMVPYAALALGAMIWSCGFDVKLFGWTLAPGPHMLLQHVPGARGLRVLVRMGAIADLALAVLGACTLARLAGCSKRLRATSATVRALLTATLCLFILLENVPRGGTTFRRSRVCVPPPRRADRWLAAQSSGAIVELPLTVSASAEGQRLWYQISHRRPMVNGAETFFRINYYEDVRLFARPASPAAMARMRQIGLRFVVLDRHNPFAGEMTFLGPVPSMPDALPAPFVLRYWDDDVRIYEIPQLPKPTI